MISFIRWKEDKENALIFIREFLILIIPLAAASADLQ